MESKSSIVEWVSFQLTTLLKQPVSPDMTLYIISIESEKDFEEYMQELLSESVSSMQYDLFMGELKSRWKSLHSTLPAGARILKKHQAEVPVNVNEKKSKKKNKKPVEVINLLETNHSECNGVNSNIDKFDSNQEFHKKKKDKFVPLFGDAGIMKTIGAILPGRHPCECQATKHKLINNCTDCGRVVCDQEGSGPCLYCGCLVCTRGELEVLQRGSKKSEKLRAELLNKGQGSSIPSSLEKAISHKDKLLEYDKNSVKRTQVLDDDLDYFSTDSNQWLSNSDRQKLQKREEELRGKRHASRLDRKVTLDFAGRKVIDEPSHVDMYDANDEIVREVQDGVKSVSNSFRNIDLNGDYPGLVNPTINQEQPTFVEADIDKIQNGYSKALEYNADEDDDSSFLNQFSNRDRKRLTVVQDKEIQEISDHGMCLSMHQPYASLLVCGVKKDEGRTWYSAHRGRLWIGSGAKKIASEEIAEIERLHLNRNDADMRLPKNYPNGCLLGCVNVEDCLEQKVYREKYPHGDSGSPFVLVCSNPQELVVKFPIQGKHKIYKLDENIHQAAKKGLR